jgi:adenylosuccinate lyase
LLAAESRIVALVAPQRIEALLDPSHYVGDAPERARAVVERIGKLEPFPAPRALKEINP